jgi:hypothetical protein
MSLISFEKLHQINLETAAKSIATYSAVYGPWLKQFDNFYNNIRLNALPAQRMNDLLNIVRYNGWNMNRQGQCASILKDIQTKKISRDQLNCFWSLVDKLSNISLCQLSSADNSIFDLLIDSFTRIRGILSSCIQALVVFVF